MEKKKKIFLEVLLVSVLSILSFLSGCSKGGTNGNEGSTVTLAEGATLTGLYMTHQGMAMEPYYMLRVTDEGTYMKISNLEPDSTKMTEDGNPDGDLSEEEAKYFGFVNTVKDCEHASLVETDDKTVQDIYDIVIQSGALNWDGYSIHRDMKGVDDAGDGYQLYLTFSDGTTVTVSSYNSSPKGWGDFFCAVQAVFDEQSDYSRYTIQDFSEDKCDRMIVEFTDGNFNPTNMFKLDINVRRDLGTWSWSVRIKDDDGVYLEKGTDISATKEESIDTFSCSEIIDVLNETNIQEWDGTHGSLPDETRYMNVLISDSENKVVQAYGNNVPENYDEVREAFVKALIEFYEERK